MMPALLWYWTQSVTFFHHPRPLKILLAEHRPPWLHRQEEESAVLVRLGKLQEAVGVYHAQLCDVRTVLFFERIFHQPVDCTVRHDPHEAPALQTLLLVLPAR